MKLASSMALAAVLVLPWTSLTEGAIAKETIAQGTASNTAADAAQVKDSGTQTFWIFLITGKSTQGVAQTEIAEMQQAHLANFGRLAQAGKLLSAGPLRDPEQTLRGIVVLQAEDQAALAEMFEPDPYVGPGYMQLKSFPAELSLGKFTTKLNEQGLDELRIAVLSSAAKGEAWLSTDDIAALGDNEALQLALAARFTEESELRGCLIFRSTDDAEIKSALDSLSTVKSGELSYALMPQYLGKGAIEAADN